MPNPGPELAPANRPRWRWSPRGVARLVRHRLSARPDSEHEITWNRLALSWVIAVFLISASEVGNVQALHLLALSFWMLLVYNALSLLLFAHLIVYPGVSVFRRCVGICIDFWVIAAFDRLGDSATGFIYPLYLWTIFGNGFRFGIPYLAIATIAGISAFSTVALTGSYWQTNFNVAIGMLVGLIILPAYVGLLIHKVSVARRQAEEANKAKSMFLASVSHELRTPLTAIIGLTDLLQDTPLNREQREMTQTVGSSGRGLLRLINSLLEVSRAEVGPTPVKMSTIDVYVLLAEVRDMLSVQARNKGLQLALHISARTPRRVIASERHLQETLINLAGNAVKFTDRGYVLMFVDCVGVTDAVAQLRFEVEDSGIGIAADAQARIFDAFAQADETIIDRYGGTGLGLAISRQLVEAQNGRIGVASVEGQGSTFWFEIEAIIVAANNVAPQELSPQAARRAVVTLSGDPRIQAAVERAGADARVVFSAQGAKNEMKRLAASGAGRPIVLLDEIALGREIEASAGEIIDADPSRSAVLIALSAGSEVDILSHQGRQVFVTCLPRPLDVGSLATFIEYADGFPQQRSAQRENVLAARRCFRVLVAEDNRTNQMVISRILEKAGHEVEIANDGEEALDLLETGRFQIVLMDVNMPVLNGIEAAKLYRFTHVDEMRTPIVALTADISDASQERCLAAGMQACLPKPIDGAQLLATIEALAMPGPALARDFAGKASEGSARSNAATAESDESVDLRALQDLEQLGGPQFLDEIVSQFTADAANVLAAMSAAASSGDVDMFRDQAHALRSCAANVGAQKVYNICLSWRDMAPEDLAGNSAAYLAGLEAELAQAHDNLAAYLAKSADKEPSLAPGRPALRIVS